MRELGDPVIIQIKLYERYVRVCRLDSADLVAGNAQQTQFLHLVDFLRKDCQAALVHVKDLDRLAGRA